MSPIQGEARTCLPTIWAGPSPSIKSSKCWSAICFRPWMTDWLGGKTSFCHFHTAQNPPIEKGLGPTHLLSVLAIEPVMLPILPVSLASEEDLLDLPLWGTPASSPFRPVFPNFRKPPLFPRSRNIVGLDSWPLRPFGSEPVSWS